MKLCQIERTRDWLSSAWEGRNTTCAQAQQLVFICGIKETFTNRVYGSITGGGAVPGVVGDHGGLIVTTNGKA